MRAKQALKVGDTPVSMGNEAAIAYFFEAIMLDALAGMFIAKLNDGITEPLLSLF